DLASPPYCRRSRLTSLLPVPRRRRAVPAATGQQPASDLSATGAADAAAPTGAGMHPDTRAYAFLERLDVGDDADQLALLLQPGQGGQGGIQRLLVEGGEALVKEQRINPHIAAGHLRQPQGQRQADNEAFPTGQVLGRTHFAGLIVVEHVQLQWLLRI